ncbi:MAG: phospholipase D family protein [Neisseria sp.]|nr:phospholipase D family protein [Neisseria sp.]
MPNKSNPMRPFLIAALCGCLLAACRSLPDISGRPQSLSLPPEQGGRIQQAWQLTPHRPGESSVYLLADAHDALVARAVLLAQAERSLDIAYYIWHDDVSGRMLMAMLQQAARRGVRVRLLLDDNNTRGTDHLLAALDAEPNLEIRLFNPFLHRRLRPLGYLTDFPRLNRRMHNKSFTADGKISIVGGRNIGDEYFQVGGEAGFADLDILATGSITAEISRDFDRYWNSASSYAFADIVPEADAAEGQALLDYAESDDAPVWQQNREQILNAPLFRDLSRGKVNWTKVRAKLVSDDPAKALARGKAESSAAEKLAETLGRPEKEMYIVSPYFVPADDGVAALADLQQNGVNVNILTNSLHATDVAAVHSGYARYRKPLLQNGIGLYELKSAHALPKSKDRGLTGSSVTSLHAKTLIADGRKMYVGSFNFDPRSARLNTESGIVIEHQGLVGAVQRSLLETTPQHAYRVVLNRQNRLQWYEPPPEAAVHNSEPEAGFWKRLGVKILSMLPIEQLL